MRKAWYLFFSNTVTALARGVTELGNSKDLRRVTATLGSQHEWCHSGTRAVLWQKLRVCPKCQCDQTQWLHIATRISARTCHLCEWKQQRQAQKAWNKDLFPLKVPGKHTQTKQLKSPTGSLQNITPANRKWLVITHVSIEMPCPAC